MRKPEAARPRGGARACSAGPARPHPLVRVEGLCKRYPSFELRDVSFEVQPGSITGFIGRNGAGKTTTLKCLAGAVRPDAGVIEFFGMPLAGNERAIKQITGFSLGGADYFPTKTLGAVAAVTRRFFELWDDDAYRGYCRAFDLDGRKKIGELSAGMRVKFALALSLSHGSKLLVLDEPTSGLDPASRNEVLDVFLDVVRDGRAGILFSTHITSDLDKCADAVVHIHNGRLVGAASLQAYCARFRVADANEARSAGVPVLGVRRTARGDTALVNAAYGMGRAAALEDVMDHASEGSVYE